MERLIEVFPGKDSTDIAVGVSGFGSATVPPSRWRALGELTGRRAFTLLYDAQAFPFEGPLEDFDFSLLPEFYRRWDVARRGAEVAVDHLVHWLRMWTEQGRRVLLVGFSLGAMVSWRAAQQVGSPLVDVVMLCGALGNRPRMFQGVEKVGRVLNVFSNEDLALRLLYPTGVASDETPAAGLGPLVISDRPNVTNIDVTDLVGMDHLWASYHLDELLRTAIGCWLGSEHCSFPFSSHEDDEVSEEAVDRLYRYGFIDPLFTSIFARALSGDREATSMVLGFDQRSLRDLDVLFESGSAAKLLFESRNSGFMSGCASDRSLLSLRGMFRRFVQSTSRSGSSMSSSLESTGNPGATASETAASGL